jgi:integrase
MLELMTQYDKAVKELFPDREYFFPNTTKSLFLKQSWVTYNFRQMWYKYNNSYAIAYDLRHNYVIENINSWIGEGFGFHDKLLYLSKTMGHSRIESTRYYYSLVPGLADILHSNSDEDMIVPEVNY